MAEPRSLNFFRDVWDENGNHWSITVDLKAITPEYVRRTQDKMDDLILDFEETVEKFLEPAR